jgi:hypothetical protein
VPKDVYGHRGECPPSGDIPYQGFVRTDGPVGFRIQLYEAGCDTADTLIGQGSTLRKNIQIHFGAAATYGCFMVAGRRAHYHSRFKRPIRAMLARDSTIEVVVEPRQPE